MAQDKINKQDSQVPEALYTLIGEFALTFPKLSEYKQREAKKQLARTIALSYSEYKDIIIDYFTIPFIKVEEFKQLYRDAESQSLRNTNELIRKYNLEEYRDIIIDNYSLTISALINIAEYCYQQTNNILDACRSNRKVSVCRETVRQEAYSPSSVRIYSLVKRCWLRRRSVRSLSEALTSREML